MTRFFRRHAAPRDDYKEAPLLQCREPPQLFAHAGRNGHHASATNHRDGAHAYAPVIAATRHATTMPAGTAPSWSSTITDKLEQIAEAMPKAIFHIRADAQLPAGQGCRMRGVAHKQQYEGITRAATPSSTMAFNASRGGLPAILTGRQTASPLAATTYDARARATKHTRLGRIHQ